MCKIEKSGQPDMGNLRETCFFNQMRVRNHVYASDVSDFRIGDYTFEVGGKKKNAPADSRYGEKICGERRHRIRRQKHHSPLGFRPHLLSLPPPGPPPPRLCRRRAILPINSILPRSCTPPLSWGGRRNYMPSPVAAALFECRHKKIMLKNFR